MNDNYLMHHGIKGQRWGVRRYQNADGSLTSAGLKRAKKDAKKNAKYNLKNRSVISDEQLSKSIKRMENEKRLKRATEENLKPKRSAVKKFISSNGKKIVGATSVGVGIYASKKIVSKIINKEAGSFIHS